MVSSTTEKPPAGSRRPDADDVGPVVDAEAPLDDPGPTREINGAVAGAVLGCMLVAALLITGRIVVPLRFAPDDASEEFVAAWRRSRTGTFVVDSEWKRVKDSGEVLQSASRVVQDPPRRVVHQAGSISGELDGKEVDCFTAPDGTFGCHDGAPLDRTFDQGVEQELADLRDHFRKTNPPVYRVRTDGHGCFELVQQFPQPNPTTFGRLAQVCFDERTGAMRYSERHFENITEFVRAERIRSQVVPSDFELTTRPEFSATERPAPAEEPATTAPPPSTPEGSSPSSAPAGDNACNPGQPAWDPLRCKNSGLIATCIQLDGDERVISEMYARRVSFNTLELAGTACGRRYAAYGLAQGVRVP